MVMRSPHGGLQSAQVRAALYYARQRRLRRLAASSGGGGPTPVTPDYANDGGTGDRTSTITATQTGFGALSGGTFTNIINGDLAGNASGGFWDGNQAIAGHTMQFEFGSAVYIDQFRWRQSSTSVMGTWKMQGSNNGTDWTDLSGNLGLGGQTVETFDLSLVEDNFTFYRLLGVSGNWNAGPWVQEIEFRIGVA